MPALPCLVGNGGSGYVAIPLNDSRRTDWRSSGRTAIGRSYPTVLSYSPILQSHPTYLSYSPILQSHPTVLSYSPILQSYPTVPSYRPIPQSYPKSLAYSPILQPHPTVPSYSPTYSPILQSHPTVLSYNHPDAIWVRLEQGFDHLGRRAISYCALQGNVSIQVLHLGRLRVRC